MPGVRGKREDAGMRRGRASVRWALLGAAVVVFTAYVLSVWLWLQVATPPGSTTATLSAGVVCVGHRPSYVPQWLASARWGPSSWGQEWGWWFSASSAGWPGGGWFVSIPIWAPWAVLVLFTARAWSAQPLTDEACRGCGYDLKGLGGAVCPECGKAGAGANG